MGLVYTAIILCSILVYQVISMRKGAYEVALYPPPKVGGFTAMGYKKPISNDEHY